MRTHTTVTSQDAGSGEEFMNKILRLMNSSIREDIIIGITLLFHQYPEIRKYEKPYYDDQKVVYNEDIAHIVPWISNIRYSGILTPESIKLD